VSVPSSRVKQYSRLEGNSDPTIDALVDSVYPVVDMLSDNNNKISALKFSCFYSSSPRRSGGHREGHSKFGDGYKTSWEQNVSLRRNI